MKIGEIHRWLPDGATEDKDLEVPDNFFEMSDEEFARYFVETHCQNLYFCIDGDQAEIRRIPPLTDRRQ